MSVDSLLRINYIQLGFEANFLIERFPRGELRSSRPCCWVFPNNRKSTTALGKRQITQRAGKELWRKQNCEGNGKRATWIEKKNKRGCPVGSGNNLEWHWSQALRVLRAPSQQPTKPTRRGPKEPAPQLALNWIFENIILALCCLSRKRQLLPTCLPVLPKRVLRCWWMSCSTPTILRILSGICTLPLPFG